MRTNKPACTAPSRVSESTSPLFRLNGAPFTVRDQFPKPGADRQALRRTVECQGLRRMPDESQGDVCGGSESGSWWNARLEALEVPQGKSTLNCVCNPTVHERSMFVGRLLGGSHLAYEAHRLVGCVLDQRPRWACRDVFSHLERSGHRRFSLDNPRYLSFV